MTTDKKRIRRNHSPALKAQILAECEAPGASVAKVAMSHGINANIVHGWRKLARERVVRPSATTAFVPLAIEPASPPQRRIDVELRRGAVSMTMSWPLSASAEMTTWMRELLRRSASTRCGWPYKPEDMRAGADRLLARVVQGFGSAQAHHGYLFANARGTRMKLVVHDGFGVWCATRRLNQGRFIWPRDGAVSPTLTRAQFDALVLGLPWQRLEHMQVITRV